MTIFRERIPDIKPEQSAKDFTQVLYEQGYGPMFLCKREAERQDIQRSIHTIKDIEDVKAVLTRMLGRKVPNGEKP